MDDLTTFSKKLYHFLDNAFRSIFLWFCVNVAFCILLIYLRLFLPNEISNLSDDLFNIFFSFASGGLISFLFYFLVVFVPERRRSKILKENMISLYKSIRQDVVTSVVMASIKGGREDLTGQYDEIESLTDVREFKIRFSKGKKSNEGFYAFENQMMERTFEFESIIQDIKLLASQIEFFLHNYPIQNGELFCLLKRFEVRLLSLFDSQAGYDESEPLTAFIYQWLAGWDLVSGYRDRDIFFDALEKA
ncbi:hypothetical protein [Neorhizobium petrolearium]|uniref:Phage abortive infection protein n=1 Tax=Neorhizobium petrolearium TaxID=515361 RepID=A0ABY8MBF8_9HYPH|nr:hypothetical protein [Neorhizobium petrolearium]MCC2613494.1 hypothetical protein [Neorhizobium petrolearium]WGI71818.1 hypothetical protein QEO92_27085 [Neorhizobium petrolearium]